MKTIITVKTGKGEASTEKEIDKTVDEVMSIAFNTKGNIVGGRCFCDGTMVVVVGKG